MTRPRLPALGAAVILACGLAAATARAEDPPPAGPPPPEPPALRDGGYRAVTPATLTGADVLDTAQAKALWQSHGAVFIDVLPRAPKPANLPPDTVWREPEHDDIPGSLWLPDTGYGRLAPPTEAYLRDNLQAATGGDPARMLVFYCRASCWHSWNAAKRALGMGYAHVGWFRGGIDDWQQAGLPLSPNQPRPRPAS